MARLSKEVLDEGRQLIRAKNLDGFSAWVERHVPTANIRQIRSAFGVLMALDQDRALVLFEQFFPYVNPRVEFARLFFRQGCFIFVVLGLLGGVISLIRLIFG